MLFRLAREGDCEYIAESLKEILKLHSVGRKDIFNNTGAKYSATDVKAMLSEENTCVYVAEDLTSLYGYAICKIKTINSSVLKKRKVFYLDDLFVSPQARSKGLGKAFTEYLITQAKAMECVSFELNVWEFEGSATGFYEKCGFATQRRIMEMKL